MHRNVMSQPKYGKIINCGLTILIVSMFSPSRLRNTTQLRSGSVNNSDVVETVTSETETRLKFRNETENETLS